MPKKSLNVILILVVLGLWGAIAYKSLSRFFPAKQNFSTETDFNSSGFNVKKIEKDTFDLRPLVNDPFFGRSFSQPIVAKTRSVYYVSKSLAKPKPEVKPKVMVPFPVVKYFGFIKSKDKKEEMILIKVDNTLHKTRLNANCDGVLIKKVYKDSLQVVFGKELKTIKR